MALLGWFYLGLRMLWVQCFIYLGVFPISVLYFLLAVKEGLVEVTTDMVRLLFAQILLIYVNLFLHCVAESEIVIFPIIVFLVIYLFEFV